MIIPIFLSNQSYSRNIPAALRETRINNDINIFSLKCSFQSVRIHILPPFVPCHRDDQTQVVDEQQTFTEAASSWVMGTGNDITGRDNNSLFTWVMCLSAEHFHPLGPRFLLFVARRIIIFCDYSHLTVVWWEPEHGISPPQHPLDSLYHQKMFDPFLGLIPEEFPDSFGIITRWQRSGVTECWLTPPLSDSCPVSSQSLVLFVQASLH